MTTDPRHDLIVAPLQRLCAELDIPGVAAAVVVDGTVIGATAGVVNTRTAVPVTAEAIFQIQSITKVWTATLVMQLVDEGRVDLDEPVVRYLPGFRTGDASVSARITVRQLLTHTGGFEGDDWRSTTDDDTALERFVTDVVSQEPQHLPPGERFSYCSTGMAVLGRLVEVLRRLPYPRALRRHLAEPLGLTDIAFTAGEALGFRAAIGHADGRPVRTWTYMPESNHPAGAQLSMSARSLAEFGRMHAAGGTAADGTRILSESAAKAMREPLVSIPFDTTRQGLGWQVDPTSGLVSHSGGSLGVGALLCVDPAADVVVAIAANGGDTGKLMSEYVNPILSELTGGTLPEPDREAPPVAEIVDAARYTGRYGVRISYGDVTVDDANRLWLTSYPDNEAVTLSERAGVPAEPDPPMELRRVDGEVFAIVGENGTAAGRVEFFGDADQGRFRFLHSSGRAVPRLT